MADAIAGAMADAPAFADKPVLAYVSPHAPEAAAVLSSLGVPAFTAPESCAAALLAMRHQAAGQTQREQVETKNQPVRAESALPPALVSASLTGSLNEAEAKKIFTQFGISASRECVVTSSNDALQATSNMASHGVNKFVLKILSSTMTHKSDVGGVAVNLLTEQVGDRLNQMRTLVEGNTGVVCEQFLLQEMVTGGVEMILGMHRDPTGSAILLGMGGTAAELLEDTVLRMCPVNKADAREMMESLKTWPLLNGYRGRPLADSEALMDAIVSFSNMVEQLGDRLVTAEINPLFVLEAGQGVKAADAVMVLT
jgi:acyl-CoA synthetase (NDP forming)